MLSSLFCFFRLNLTILVSFWQPKCGEEIEITESKQRIETVFGSLSPNFKDNQENGLIKKHRDSCIGSLQVRAEHEDEEGEGKISSSRLLSLSPSCPLSLWKCACVCVCVWEREIVCCSFFVVNPTPAHAARTISSFFVLACMCMRACVRVCVFVCELVCKCMWAYAG